MIRELVDHKCGDLNEAIRIETTDEPGPGGAHHRYVVNVAPYDPIILDFQKGGVKDVGANGISDEALLAIVIDRLRGFQSGPFGCRENAIVLTKLEESLHWLQERTRARQRRGVEGKLIA